MVRIFFTALALVAATSAWCQPVVYLDFVSHNEETSVWDGNTYYNNNRTKLISLANYFQARSITWNMQSDWRYLVNVLAKDTPGPSTNNKNILVWMQDDKAVEMDPHAHESQYFYPDVVKLMDSIGLAQSKLMGGTIYNDSNGINIWTNLSTGQYGNVYPNYFWKPDYMMGGGTPNHVNDLKYYGIWNPQGPAAYLTHDTNQRLRHLGVGCSIKIKDTSSVISVVNELKTLIANIQSGAYPANGFYVQTIFFEQGDLNNLSFYNKVLAVADSANAIVNTGKAQWKTLKQAYTIWETNYNKQPFQWNCGQMTNVGAPNDAHTSIRVFPNPSSGKFIISVPDKMNGSFVLHLCAVTGQSLLSKHLTVPTTELDIIDLSPGLYIYYIHLEGKPVQSGKLEVK
jgi:hypothetical protein